MRRCDSSVKASWTPRKFVHQSIDFTPAERLQDIARTLFPEKDR